MGGYRKYVSSKRHGDLSGDFELDFLFLALPENFISTVLSTKKAAVLGALHFTGF